MEHAFLVGRLFIYTWLCLLLCRSLWVCEAGILEGYEGICVLVARLLLEELGLQEVRHR